MKPIDEANEAIRKMRFKWIFVLNDDLLYMNHSYRKLFWDIGNVSLSDVIFRINILKMNRKHEDLYTIHTEQKRNVIFGIILTGVTYVRNFSRYEFYYWYYYYHYSQTITQFHCCGIWFIFRGISDSFWHIFH